MDPVTASVTIDRPREEVFEYLADIANHAEFSDHYLKEWRLTRVESYGRGAGARFKIGAPLDRYAWGDMTFIEVEPPYRIVAAGRAGKFNRNKTWTTWTLEPSGNATRVEVTTESEPALPTDKLMEAVTGRRGWTKRKLSQGAQPHAVDPRGGHRSRAARHGRRAVTSASVRGLLAHRARARGRRLRREARVRPRGGDRGHLRRRRQPRLPGPDVALPQSGRRRGSRVPDGPAGGRAGSVAGRRNLVRRLDARQELHGRDARRRRRRSRSWTPRRTSSGRCRWPTPTCSPSGRRRSAPTRSSRSRTPRPPAGRSRAR